MTKLSYALAYSFAIAWAIIVITPFIWALRMSLTPTYTTFVSFLPKNLSEISLINYRYLLFQTNFPRWMLNSCVVSAAATVINVIASAMLGYVLARRKIPGSRALFLIILALMMVPYHVTVVALYLGLSKLKLTNSLLGVILPLSANAMGVFMMHQYILMIPKEIEEAALVDGCSPARAFFSVVLPQVLPAVGVLSITMFFETWNNFIIPLIMLTKSSLKTVTVGIAELTFQTLNVNWGVLMAGALLGTIPTLVVFLVFNKRFLQGLTLHGGLK